MAGMDMQNRPGGKTGTGGPASWSEANRDRRERLRQLALETIDLNKDPYFMKNHLGTYECKLCLTLHNNEGSYLAHTQGKKHQTNLAKRAAKEAAEQPVQPAPEKARVDVKKFVKIGRPGYKVTKQRDPDSGQQSLLFQIDYPEIVEAVMPRYRFMSAYEQRVEPPDKRWQYLLFAAEPYETMAFKVPSREVDKDPKKLWTHWNKVTRQYYLQFAFRYDSSYQSRSDRGDRDYGGRQDERAPLPPPPTLPRPPAPVAPPPPFGGAGRPPPPRMPPPPLMPPPPSMAPPMGAGGGGGQQPPLPRNPPPPSSAPPGLRPRMAAAPNTAGGMPPIPPSSN